MPPSQSAPCYYTPGQSHQSPSASIHLLLCHCRPVRHTPHACGGLSTASVFQPAYTITMSGQTRGRPLGGGGKRKKRGLPPEAHTGSHCVTAGRPSRQHQRQGRPSRTPHTHAPSTHASMDDGERYIQVQYLAQPSALLRKNPATCQTATSVPSEHVTAICGCGCGLGDHVHTPQTHSPARHASAVLVVV